MLNVYQTQNIRNVAILGHSSTGKSTLFDAILLAGKQIDRIGSSKDGSLISDFDEEEKKREISIRSALGFVEIDDIKINILDTPGMSDFVGEARAALQAAEIAILVVDSVDGVQIETGKAWRYLSENNIPRIIFINKMDKERANYEDILNNMKTDFNADLVSLAMPIGQGDDFKGVIDLIRMKSVTPKDDGKNELLSNIPEDMQADVEAEREKLIELAAEGDDELIEKFLEGEELTEDEISIGIKNMVHEAKLHPVICGSSLKAIGIHNLLKIIVNFAPSPAVGKEFNGYNPNDIAQTVTVKSTPDSPVSCVVWKTYIDQYAGRSNYLKVVSGELLPDMELMNPSKNLKERISKVYTMLGNKQIDVQKICSGDIGVVVKLEKTCTVDTLCDPKNPVILPIIDVPQPVFSYSIEPTKKGDEDKIGQIFGKVVDENPTITYTFNPETRQTVLSGMGEMQLDIILNSIKEKNNIDLITDEPRVAYRETITKQAEAQYKHKKQTGGHGQYGEVYIRVKPKERGTGFEFINNIVGGVIPRQYIPGCEKGLREGMDEGVLAKYPVVDFSAELFDGSFHPVDSSEMSFKLAARHALKKAFENAGPQLLEPIMEVDIYVEKELMGDILNDITSRRGRVLGMGSQEESSDNGVSVVKAQAPLAEMLRYSIDLRSMTSGKATFEMKHSHYDPISGKIAENVIEDRKKQLEEDANK
ncbi:MAG: elongation factor G [Spirochaetota bacterium]|nr:elongation factor G [Spirochaetota bacterium]